MDTYALKLAASKEGYLGPLAAEDANATNSVDGAGPEYWSEWGLVFPRASFMHNRFYDAVGPMLGLLMACSLIYPLSMLIR